MIRYIVMGKRHVSIGVPIVEYVKGFHEVRDAINHHKEKTKEDKGRNYCWTIEVAY